MVSFLYSFLIIVLSLHTSYSSIKLTTPPNPCASLMEHGIVSVAGGVGDGNAVVDEEVLDLWSLIRETKAQKRKELNVSNRGLVDLPVEICSLYSLKKLSLHHNKLHTLPTCISHLTSLRVLTLYTNNLRTLPSSIGHLMLQKLSLSHNQLQFLPPEITKLTNLQYLSLNNNKLGNERKLALVLIYAHHF